ncbi:RsmB/NOP family class I SAM-dependent RNA methyltransferase [Aquamicrobium segne]|uniref:RsmB/NOP family class I SAM-dependent RNA methyltransferase n=1 Tax=Aquamicrobium segne TaxID=469547 RepID=A0ABW0H035_9HYPH
MKPAQPARKKHHSGKDKFRDASPSIPGLAARKTAARLLGAVIDTRTALDGMTDNEHGHPNYMALDMRDRALVRAMLGAALRHRMTIAALLAKRLEKPLPANATTLSHILHIAAAQILFLDVPDSAAVDLAVTHAKSDPRTRRFDKLVNAVLRALVRMRETELEPALAATDDAPQWFLTRLNQAYGKEQARAILAAHRFEPPIDLTVKSDPQGWAERLGGIVLPTGSVRLEKLTQAVPELPGFEEGEWWVQDAAAALPARLMGTFSGSRVADLCAAPGGKTAQLVLAGAQVTALDASQSRLKRLARNLERLHFQADIIHSDLLDFTPPDLFDAVLLDAPCSSTGTIRRHPDVAWTKTPDDIAKLASLQRRLLDKAFTLIRPGGIVLFSNCSLDPLEGEDLLTAFLDETPDAELDPIQPQEAPGIAPFITPQGTLRTTPAGLDMGSPTLSGLDGFYAARIRKRG